jgi:tetratricopeptide (TPR) repeat protein
LKKYSNKKLKQMKKIFTPLLLMVIGLSQITAQNVDDNRVTFRYFQLPTQPIKGQSFYTIQIDHDMYHKNNQDSLSFYNNNPNSYQAQMNRWMDDVKRIDKAYFLEMAKWEKAFNAGQQEPQPLKTPYPPMPSVTNTGSPILTEEITAEVMNANLNIEGMTKGFEGVIVKVQPQGFLNASIREAKSGTGATTKYTYVANYKMPFNITVEVPGQGIILNEVLNNTILSENINSYASKYEYEYWKVDNYEQFWKTTQTKAVLNAIRAVNDRLNDLYGTPLVTRSTDVYTVKKYQKHEYNDLIDAYTQVKQGYDKLFLEKSKATALPFFNNAIKIWESALAEGSGGKKDRINDKVVALLYVNLGEAYLWIDEFAKSENYLMKAIQQGGIFNKYRSDAENLQKILNNQKARFLANQ